MKISIIIPTYNVESYIKECLYSVASQTYKGDIECIVVDDCSTDKSIKIAQEFIKTYIGKIQFKICHRENNGGLSAARNTGTMIATGKYIYYLDSDDAITPNCIEQLVNTAQKHPDADVVQAGIMDMNRNIIFDTSSKAYPDIITERDQLYKRLIIPGQLPVSSWNKLIKREFIVENKIFFYEGVIHEDVDFIYKIASYIKCLAICRVNTYLYRTQREGSILNTTNTDKSTASRIIIYNSCLDSINEQNRLILTRSLFLRLQDTLLSPPESEELNKKLYSLCNRISSNAVLKDRIIMKTYFFLPNFLQHKLYNTFRKIFILT